MDNPGTITRAVNALAGGQAPADAAVRRVYDELRSLAASRLARDPAATLQPTDLVHEAFVRLFSPGQPWDSRRHFFGSAARAMQQLLIDRWRGRHVAPASNLDRFPAPDAIDPLALSEAIDQLQAHDAGLAEIVRLRVFAGLSVEQTAEALDLSTRTVKRHWAYARTWLFQRLAPDHPQPPAP